MSVLPQPHVIRTSRDQQKDETRKHIIDAAVGLARQAGEDGLTFRAVATASGLTERTVYRHFESRDALLMAVWRRLIELVGPRPSIETTDALIEEPVKMFPRLEREQDLLRAFLYSELAKTGLGPNKERRRAIVECVGQELEGLDNRSLRRRAAIAALIASPYAWHYLQTSWGFSGNYAGRAAAEALEILLNRRLAY